jgi:hypothetical protein
MNFYETIKETIQEKIEDKEINLSSFIISVTPFQQLRHWQGGRTINKFNDRNVYFIEEQRDVYIGDLLAKMRK